MPGSWSGPHRASYAHLAARISPTTVRPLSMDRQKAIPCNGDYGESVAELQEQLEALEQRVQRKNARLGKLQDELRDRESQINRLIEECEEKDRMLRGKARTNKSLLMKLNALASSNMQHKCVGTDTVVVFDSDQSMADLPTNATTSSTMDDKKTSPLNQRLSGMLHTMESLQSKLASLQSCAVDVEKNQEKPSRRTRKVTFSLPQDGYAVNSSQDELKVSERQYATLRAENDELKAAIVALESELCALQAKSAGEDASGDEKRKTVERQCRASVLRFKAQHMSKLKSLEETVLMQDIQLQQSNERLASLSQQLTISQQEVQHLSSTRQQLLDNLADRSHCEQQLRTSLDNMQSRLVAVNEKSINLANEFRQKTKDQLCTFVDQLYELLDRFGQDATKRLSGIQDAVRRVENDVDVLKTNHSSNLVKHSLMALQQSCDFSTSICSYTSETNNNNMMMIQSMNENLLLSSSNKAMSVIGDYRRPGSSMSTSSNVTWISETGERYGEKLERLRRLNRRLDQLTRLPRVKEKAI